MHSKREREWDKEREREIDRNMIEIERETHSKREWEREREWDKEREKKCMQLTNRKNGREDVNKLSRRPLLIFY